MRGKIEGQLELVLENDLFHEDDIAETPAQDDGLVEWKDKKSKARAKMVAMQRLPFDVKKKRSELRANEFAEQMEERAKEIGRASCRERVYGLV